jgi:hypothetical protein
MMRACVAGGLVLLAVFFVAGTGTSGGTKKPKGSLPIGWKKLDLTKEQEVKIRGISADYSSKIKALYKQIDDLREQEKAAQVKVLNEDQKEKLRKLVLGETPAKDKKITPPPKEK